MKRAAALLLLAPGLAAAAEFFDDFRHADREAMRAAGWIVRERAGHPGLAGARWGEAGVIPLPAEDPAQAVLRLEAETDGTPAGTRQAQLCHQRKFFEGTSAARVRFSDTPAQGPDGDVVVQTFYLVSPLRFAFDPEFSELDWEYLPNGGWGDARTRLYAVSWQTVRIDPWQAHNQHAQVFGAQAGWHTLVSQARQGKIRHFLDGREIGAHGGRNYPVVPMALQFNLWFSPGGTLPSEQGKRHWRYEIDWVYHARDAALEPAEVEAAVARLRGEGVGFRDEIMPAGTPLVSECAM